MNTYEIPTTAGVEKDSTTGLPVFRVRSNLGGSPTNDFEDLLDGGVSPLMQSPDGLAAFTHMRTTYTVDDTFDALMTLLIKDQVFIDIRSELTSGVRGNFLRMGNTPSNRQFAVGVVNAYLASRANWISPVQLTSGATGYGVSAVPSTDGKSFTIYYYGMIVRGTNKINISGSLTISE